MSALLWLGAAGCAVGPDYHAPQMKVPERWSGTQAPATTQPVEVTRWWTLFNDPALARLIDQAVQTNLDVRMARAHLREARALRATALAAFLPEGELRGSYQNEGRSMNRKPEERRESRVRELRDRVVSESVDELVDGSFSPQDVAAGVLSDTLADRLTRDNATNTDWHTRNFFELGFDATWELDVFGGARRGAEAAEADAAAASEDLHDVVLTLLFEVARNYIEMRGHQQRSAIAQQNIDRQETTLRLIRAQYAAGMASELDVTKAERLLLETRTERTALETLARQATHQLSLLLGEFHDASRPEFAPQTESLVAVLEIPLGLPSDLLRRRPDIRRSERQFAAATARIGVATADLFPRFSLTGTFGTASHDVRHVLDSKSLFWSVGPAVSWPILDGARVVADIHAQEALQGEALAAYELSVLTAVSEVDTALMAYQNERTRCAQLTDAVGVNGRDVRISHAQYDGGIIEFPDVIDSERALRKAEDELAQSQTTLALHAISLFKALGGGWDAYTDLGGAAP